MDIKIYPIKYTDSELTEETVEAFRKRLPVYGELIQPGEYRSWWSGRSDGFELFVERAKRISIEKVSHVIESVELKDGDLTAGIRFIKDMGEREIEFGVRGFGVSRAADDKVITNISNIITFDLLG